MLVRYRDDIIYFHTILIIISSFVSILRPEQVGHELPDGIDNFLTIIILDCIFIIDYCIVQWLSLTGKSPSVYPPYRVHTPVVPDSRHFQV